MKNKCLIFVLLTGIACSASAQLQSRLIAFSSWDYDINQQNLVLRDTIDYTYSGNRGSNMKTGVYKYDVADIRSSWIGGIPPQPSKIERKTIQTFDNNNNILTRTEQRFDGFTWSNTYRYSYEYYPNGILKSETEENGDGKGNLYPFMKREYIYNPNGTMGYQLGYMAGGNSLKLNDSTAYIYSGNKLQKELTFDMDPTPTPLRETEYTYDNSGNLLSSVQKRFKNGQWENYYKQDYVYNADNTVASLTAQSWLTPQGWRNSSLTYYSYDNNKNVILDSVLTWDFANSNWSNFKKTVNMYDANQNITTQTEMKFNNGSFENDVQKTWTYNQHDQPLLYEPKGWNASTQTWEYKPFMQLGDVVKRYYYEKYNSIKNVASENFIQVYPIPAENYLHINISLHATGNFDLYLYDISGRILKMKKGLPGKTTSVVIPVSDLPTGLYVVKIDAADIKLTRTVLVER